MILFHILVTLMLGEVLVTLNVSAFKYKYITSGVTEPAVTVFYATVHVLYIVLI